ncbi:esterase [Flavobacterium sp.]
MKGNLLLLCLFLSFGIKGQENISFAKKAEIVSPQINPGNTVTFRFETNDAKIVSVQGDCCPQGGNFVKDNNGIWTFTTQKLDPELYSYTFLVDGVKVHDPNNPFLIRDVASVVNVMIVPGGKADLYKVSNVPHGSVTKRWYTSPTLNLTRRVTIYTPPGYETSKEKFPVLYLMHGAGGDEEAWMELGRTAQILDNLIAQRKAKPMIVVMPNGNAGQTAAPGESSEGFVKPVFLRPEMLSGQTEAAFGDMLKFVESNYRVKNEKASRAIAGLSMGGMHTLVISANYPDTFDYVGVFSSGMLQPKDSNAPAYTDFDSKLAKQKSNGYKLYWIGIGKEDFLFTKSNEFRNKLDNIGFKYTYKETNGGHTWSNWRDYLSEFATLLF